MGNENVSGVIGLAHHVKRRRQQLMLRQRDVEARGGPTPKTQQRIENNSMVGEVSARTLEAFDNALRWMPGSAAEVYTSGKPPVALEDVTPTDPDDLLAIQQFRDEVRASMAGITAPEAARQVEKLNHRLDEIVERSATREAQKTQRAQAEFFTQQLEQSRAVTPVMEQAFRHLMVVEPDMSTTERDEVLYRLWLVGRDDPAYPLTEDQLKDFRDRIGRVQRP